MPEMILSEAISSETISAEQDRLALDLLMRGFQVSRMLRLVADLEIADKIPPDRAVAVSDIAEACAVQHQPLNRILRALAAFDVFTLSIDGTVRHTVRSSLLRTDTPNSLHHAARFWTGPGQWKAWGMLDAAMTGGSPHEAAWHIDRFTYLRHHPEESRVFDAMMAHFPDNRHAAIAAAYDFSSAQVIADVGGGNGEMLRQILSRFPVPRGVVFDREDVVATATPDQLMGGRITAEGGCFFNHVPAGADIYLLTRVLHDWNDEDCLRILHVCRKAMRPDSILLLGEDVLDIDPESGKATRFLIDTHVMAMFDRARARNEAEFRGLLDRAGFTLQRIIATTSPVSIIEARPVATGGGSM
jgi:hypothetical protein